MAFIISSSSGQKYINKVIYSKFSYKTRHIWRPMTQKQYAMYSWRLFTIRNNMQPTRSL